MTSQQPPEGLSAENRALIERVALISYADLEFILNAEPELATRWRAVLAARSTSPAPDPKAGGLTPANQDTHRMLQGFGEALADKLARAELKYGYTNGWLTDDWETECRSQLRHHTDKGDPLDVAAYAAFCWARGWSTCGSFPAIDHVPLTAQMARAQVDLYADMKAERDALAGALAGSRSEAARAHEKVSRLTELLDQQLGTPCEQIRRQQALEDLGKGLPHSKDATSPTPAKAGEREQVAEAEQELREALADNSLAHHVHAQKSAVRTVLSALAEARSEVERVKGELADAGQYTQAHERLDDLARQSVATVQAERDTLAAQLVGAREALEPFAKHADLAEANFKPGALIDGMFLPYVKLGECRAARQALSMSILRGDKGCSLGDVVQSGVASGLTARPQTEASEPAKPSEGR